MRAPLRSAAAARRSCAWTEAATNSGEPGFGTRFLSSARRARGARRGLAHHGNVGTPGYSYRARGQPPITQSRQGKLRGPAYNPSSDRSLRRAPGAVNATLRPPVSTRRVIDMVALLLVVPAANSSP